MKNEREKLCIPHGEEVEFLEFRAKVGDLICLFHPSENYESPVDTYLILTIDKKLDHATGIYSNESILTYVIDNSAFEMYSKSMGDFEGNCRLCVFQS